MAKVVIISAHPDDEVIGAGGTLLKHNSNGDEVSWIIVTHIFENQGFSKERIISREREIEKVAGQLGVRKVINFAYPTMSLDSSNLKDLIPKISSVFQDIRPEIIYVMNRSDAHSDHRVVFNAVAACTKSFRYPFVKKVLMYECLSETEFAPSLHENAFIPNYFVDITAYIDQKLEILKIYESELGEHPFPRSLNNTLALAHFRGASVGVNYAEAFQLVKFIDKE